MCFLAQGLINEQGTHPLWAPYVQSMLLGGLFQWPRGGGHDDKAHPPIHPTKAGDSQWPPEKKRVYEYIVRHFLA